MDDKKILPSDEGKQQKIGRSEDLNIGTTDDQQVASASVDPQVSESAEPVVQPISESEAEVAENTDTPTPADTAETPTDEVSEQIPEPEVQAIEGEASPAETTEDTVDADVVEQAADTSSDDQDIVVPSDREESLDSIPEIATSPAATRNDEKEAADPSVDQTDSTEPSDNSEHSDDSDSPIAPITPANDNPNAKWYVVHTFSGHENKVATNLKQRIDSEHLENRIIDILVPTQDKIEIRGGKKEQVKEKIFPGYILVKMDLDDASWLAVRTTQGVTAFVGMNNKPTPISEREVQSIVKFMTQGAPATFKDVFMVDDTVKIIDGPFTDFIGKVESVDKEKGKVRVLVSIFGRETPVELDFLQVTKL